jgi:hypothetical protein
MDADACFAVFVSAAFAAQYVHALAGEIVYGAGGFANDNLAVVIGGAGLNGGCARSGTGGACRGNVTA